MDWLIQNVGALADQSLWMFLFLFVCALANVFFPPVPIETLTVFAGCLSGTGHGHLLVVIIATVAGTVAGSLALFGLARRYGEPLVEKTVLRRILNKDSLRRAEGWFEKYGLWTIFLGKLVPGMSLCTVTGCGIFRMHTWKAVVAITVSNLLFFGGLSWAGLSLGANWEAALGWVKQLGIVATLVVLGVILAVFLLMRRARKKA